MLDNSWQPGVPAGIERQKERGNDKVRLKTYGGNAVHYFVAAFACVNASHFLSHSTDGSIDFFINRLHQLWDISSDLGTSRGIGRHLPGHVGRIKV